MWRLPLRLALAVALSLSIGRLAEAASLEIEPVALNIVAPAAATSITLRNPNESLLNVQVRIFRWVQRDGEERLEPTQDVVASPPAVRLKPNAEYKVRVVRLTKSPVADEESYRLIVDQLPDLTKPSNRAVNFLMRQSLPVFFTAPEVTPASLNWNVAAAGKALVLTARNEGSTRLRIAALSIADNAGGKRSFGPGLLGYVLGHSTMQWRLGGAAGFVDAGSITITAQSDQGPIEQVVMVRAGD